MVDVETGDEPRAMRTLQEASADAPQDPAGRWVGNGRAVKRPSSKPTAAAASRSRSQPARATQKAPISVPEPAPSRTAEWQPAAAELFTDDAAVARRCPGPDGRRVGRRLAGSCSVEAGVAGLTPPGRSARQIGRSITKISAAASGSMSFALMNDTTVRSVNPSMASTRLGRMVS